MTADEIVLKRDRDLLERERASALQLKTEDIEVKTNLTIIHTLVHPNIEVERSGKHFWC